MARKTLEEPIEEELESVEEETPIIEKPKKESKSTEKSRMYKGYDIKWLKEIGEEHPDYYLVEEYERQK